MSTPPPLTNTKEASQTPVLLDTDIGSNVDDLLALLFMLGSQNLELVGVTTVYGDTHLRARIAAARLSIAGRDDVPIGFGSAEPRSGRDVFWTGHEGEGFDLSQVEDPETTAAAVYADALRAHVPTTMSSPTPWLPRGSWNWASPLSASASSCAAKYPMLNPI